MGTLVEHKQENGHLGGAQNKRMGTLVEHKTLRGPAVAEHTDTIISLKGIPTLVEIFGLKSREL
jgi:hypothetical protein